MKGMGWKDDVIYIAPNPENNTLIIYNKRRKPAGLTGFQLNIENARWIRNKKKYSQELALNLSEDARRALHETDWNEEEDGGYGEIVRLDNFIEDLRDAIKNYPDSLKESLSAVEIAYIKHLKEYVTYLEKKGGKKPDGIDAIERKYEDKNAKTKEANK